MNLIFLQTWIIGNPGELELIRGEYAVDDTFERVAVLAIRERPPYDYDDLTELLAQLE